MQSTLEDVTAVRGGKLHHPRRHAAASTDEFIFSQLIPYIGNKRKLLHVIAEAVEFTGCKAGTFADMFTGSTVVARWAKKQGFRVIANDWEPYSYQIALGTVVPNRPPAFKRLGGADRVFRTLNELPPLHGYVAAHLCPRDDENPDPLRERMFFTRANGERIDAIGEQIAAWSAAGAISPDQRAYVMASFIYAVSYASNTSGVFKGFHNGWGGKTGTALYRIRGTLSLQQPILHDNGKANLALRRDAQTLAGELPEVCGGIPDIVYIDPPYNQHPYGSNYHVLNTIALWDKPPISPGILVDGRKRDKSAIRTDWRTLRRSPYNSARDALPAFRALLDRVQARWVLVSYSTDGNIPLEGLLTALAERGQVHVFAQKYKRYRVSTPRMSPRPHNVEFVAVLETSGPPCPARVGEMADAIHRRERQPPAT
jgi:adenine-specific DNA-methyltransferase